MSNPRLCWVVVVRDPRNGLVPVAIAETEERAYDVAAEAADAVSLGIAYGVPQSVVQMRDAVVKSMEVRRAWVLIEGEDE